MDGKRPRFNHVTVRDSKSQSNYNLFDLNRAIASLEFKVNKWNLVAFSKVGAEDDK